MKCHISPIIFIVVHCAVNKTDYCGVALFLFFPNKMAVNIKNILNILVAHFKNEAESDVSQEEQRIADSLIDTLLAYCDNKVDEDEYLEVEDGKSLRV